MPDVENTRERILRTAFNLFITHSYHKVSIDEIISEAGVSKGGLFHYFDSKYDLASEAILSVMEKEWEQLIISLEAVEEPAERLRKLIDISVDMAMESPKLIMFFIELFEESIRIDDAGDGWMEFLERFIGVIGKFFEECGIPGPMIKAQILIASLDAISMQALLLKQAERAFDTNILKQEIYQIFVGNYISDAGYKTNYEPK